MNKGKYKEFLYINGLQHPDNLGDFWYIYNSICILNENGISTSELFPYSDRIDNYKYIVTNYLMDGRNTAYCSCFAYIDQGDKVMEEYKKRVNWGG